MKKAYHLEGSLVLEELHDKIAKEAIEDYPNEAVWLVTNNGITKVKNIAADKKSSFLVSDEDYLLASKEGLLAVIHSHPDYWACPSKSDMQQQLSTNVPWGIVSTDGDRCSQITWFGVPSKEPLVGRGFVHGVTDCYGLIRDYYLLEKSISIPEFPRDWEWWSKGENLYSDGFSKAGFMVISEKEAKVGDVWLAQVRSNVVNHGGVLIENGLTIHHPGSKNPVDKNSLSRREPIVRWLPYIVLWLRHKDVK